MNTARRTIPTLMFVTDSSDWNCLPRELVAKELVKVMQCYLQKNFLKMCH